MSDKYRWLDEYRVEVRHDERGSWHWAIGRSVFVGYDFERLDRPEKEGWERSRAAALREARYAIDKIREHERLSEQNIVISESELRDKQPDRALPRWRRWGTLGAAEETVGE